MFCCGSLSAVSLMALLLGSLWHHSEAVSVFGEETPMKTYREGEPVELKVNKMYSSSTLLSLDYYSLPFCQPKGGIQTENQNIGQFLLGDRVHNSPFEVNMKEDVFCRKMCVTNLGGRGPNKMATAIRDEYFHSWTLDGLPAAQKIEDEFTITTRYWAGPPVGFVTRDMFSKRHRKAYIHNHMNLEIMYHRMLEDNDEESYRVVRFTVEPFSIKHNFYLDGVDGFGLSQTIPSCDSKSKKTNRMHTSYDMIANSRLGPQPASGSVLFTYDVIWIENTNLKWSDRWIIYVEMDNAIPDKVHWLGITTGTIPLVCLVMVMMVTLCLNAQKKKYERLISQYDELNEGNNQSLDARMLGDSPTQPTEKWKALHGDVFRPPSFSPMLLSVACGTGAQLLSTMFLTMLSANLGWVGPTKPGSIVTAGLFFYAVSGLCAGFVTSTLYSTFRRSDPQRAIALVACGLPAVVSVVFFPMQIFIWCEGSTSVVPAKVIVMLLLGWAVIMVPLVLLGAWLGNRPISFPFETNQHERPVPHQEWYKNRFFYFKLGGILPFAACFVEVYFLASSFWEDFYYAIHGFSLLAFTVSMGCCASVTILLGYLQLRCEQHRWWWRSFCHGGSIGYYVLLYSFFFWSGMRGENEEISLDIVYFVSMFFVSLALFLVGGFVGVMGSLWFHRRLYGGAISKEDAAPEWSLTT